MPKPSPKPENTPEREKMVDLLADRAYPPRKSGRKIGYGMFPESLMEQPTHILEALTESAEKDKAPRSELRKLK